MPVFGVQEAELRPVPGRHVVPLVHDPVAGAYRFTALRFEQHRDGVPVDGARLTVVVRNEPGHPVVLANPDVRALGGFRPDPALVAAPPPPAALDAVRAQLGGGRIEVTGDKGIWAGTLARPAAPRLADVLILRGPRGKWRVLTDARTGAVLDVESLIHLETVTGTAEGLATGGVGASPCEAETLTALPHLEVTADDVVVHTDADGAFAADGVGPDPVLVTASLRGRWFEVFDFAGPDAQVSTLVDPPGPALLQFNLDDDDLVLAQVNGYIEANRVRDFILEFHPDFPGMDIPGFAVNVNRLVFPCPGNAWYDDDEISLNFCLPENGFVNTAFSSVIHHEFGHHVIESGGSGQGSYGEGMADTIAVLLADDPRVGLGFEGDCDVAFRHAENDCQYDSNSCSTCGGAAHLCGQVLSGSFWDTRVALQATDPVDSRRIVTDLALNSILVHTSAVIDPTIAIDVVTLDDDNGFILDGTPHYAEIAAGFGAHNLDPPALALVVFHFPDGLPELIAPQGGTVARVEVEAVTADPAPGSGVLYIETDGDPLVIPMTPVGPHEYEVEFPALECGRELRYAFGVDTTEGDTQFWPVEIDPGPSPQPGAGPEAWFDAIAISGVQLVLADDFEQDLGWTVSGDATDGPWERGVPIGGGDRGDPPTDADGSGACYLTDNEDDDSDVDGGSTTLTSPALDATTAFPAIAYWRWYSNTEGGAPQSDVFVVEGSDDDGASWVTLEVVGPDGIETYGGWVHRVLPLSFVGLDPSDGLRIRFTASDLGDGSVVEAAVDGVRLLELECGGFDPCPADCAGAGDGLVDVVDLAALFGQWGQTIAPCDADGDGTVGVADLLVILGAWGRCDD